MLFTVDKGRKTNTSSLWKTTQGGRGLRLAGEKKQNQDIKGKSAETCALCGRDYSLDASPAPAPLLRCTCWHNLAVAAAALPVQPLIRRRLGPGLRGCFLISQLPVIELLLQCCT